MGLYFWNGQKSGFFLSKHAWEFEPPGSKKLDTYWHKAVSVHRLWLFIPVKKHSSIGPMTLYSLIYRRSEELNFWWGYRGWRWTPGDGGEYRGRGGGSKGSRPLLSWTGQHVSCQRVVKYFKFFSFADVFFILQIWTELIFWMALIWSCTATSKLEAVFSFFMKVAQIKIHWIFIPTFRIFSNKISMILF